MSNKKYVFHHNDPLPRLSKDDSIKNILGGKGFGLRQMIEMGLPVPPIFTISTKSSIEYDKNPDFLNEIWNEVLEKVALLEEETGKVFGGENPMLLACRSGAAISMPGMMDTILNIGLNEFTVQSLARLTDNPRFAVDSYRRLIQMFSVSAKGISNDEFEEVLDLKKTSVGVMSDAMLSESQMWEVVDEFRQIYYKHTGERFPDDPHQQLFEAIEAVFKSWNSKNAFDYRNVEGIPHDLGTAVNVLPMVFGNMGNTSGTGVAFTRNPSTGVNEYWGEYLINAQGEDVVAGVRTPKPLQQLEADLPSVYKQLIEVFDILENHYEDMQDVEFTIENKQLYVLQTRTGKRTGAAAVKIAVDLVREGVIDIETAINRVSPYKLEELFHRMVDPSAEVEVLTTALPASPGAAVGKIVFDADDAQERGEYGEDVILVRRETSPDDFHGMVAAKAILTARGGMTSHAAVVARGMGTPCIAGASELRIDYENQIVMIGDLVLHALDWITIDGSSGRVINGQAPLIDPEFTHEYYELMEWVDAYLNEHQFVVWANADNGHDALVARNNGALGIGLCRTEHMFMGEDRLTAMQEMIMAASEEEQMAALSKILPMQTQDFIEIFEAMNGLPVTIRLLDPPLHEFLPDADQLRVEISSLEKKRRSPKNKRKREDLTEKIGQLRSQLEKVDQLHENNPMLGHRGCRLGVTSPEITRMQTRAIISAACISKKNGIHAIPEIMIPLVMVDYELSNQREIVDLEARVVMQEYGIDIEYTVGTMIEIPRAALTAKEVVIHADFFSFGTNDLTQMTMGLSRDDVGGWLPIYVQMGILPRDPFQSLDTSGVGKLVKMATLDGRSIKPNLKVGVCGEHGGDPESIDFFYRVGLNYVSCSPYRVPVARLASAQAILRN